MKKSILLIILVALLGSLVAHPVQIAYRKTQALAQGLRNEVSQLTKNGAEVYHYNEHYIIGGIDPQQAVGEWVPLRYDDSTSKLYLISKHTQRDKAQMLTLGKMLLDMGEEFLLATSLDESELRQQISCEFTPLERRPMLIPDSGTFSEMSREVRTEIAQLVSQVSVDSVLFFIQSLQDFQTRYALADNRLAVATWIRDQFQRFGISNAHLQPFTWNNTTQYNVIATIEGSEISDEYVIVGGHHDSITNTTPFDLAPGADDNASGSTAALEIARVLMANNYQPKTSIRFVTFAAEEFGLWGSKHYAQDALDNAQKIRLMINHDMIANSDTQYSSVRLMPYDGSIEHANVASRLTDQYTNLSTIYGTLNSSSSDSHPFWLRGYPVVYFFETFFSPVYHSDQDLVANLNPNYCAEIIKASLSIAVSYADMPSPPTNVSVRDAGTGNSLRITWNQTADPSIHHYNLYYSTQAGNFSDPMIVGGGSYDLDGLNTGTTYYIALSSVAMMGEESFKIYASGTPQVLPMIPTGFKETSGLGAIYLDWDDNTELDLAGYKIYRSITPDDVGIVVSQTTSSQFSDTNFSGVPEAFYYYSVSAFDMDTNESAHTQVLSSRPVTLDCGVLIVDESADLSGANPLLPNDVMVDEFFDHTLRAFTNTTKLDLAGATNQLRMADIGIYSSILWHGMDVSDMSAPFGIKEVLNQYISMGGKVFLTGYNPSMAFALNATYPNVFPNNSFISNVLGISNTNYSSSARFKYANPLIPGYPSLQVDSLKSLTALNNHILRVETISARDGATNIYAYGSDHETSSSAGQLNGQPIAVLNQYGLGKSFVTGVPLYFMERDSASDLLWHVFRNIFNEPSANSDEVASPQARIQILSNYPNPFNTKTLIPMKIANPSSPIDVSIYNLKGQLVKSLFKGNAKSLGEYEWDGSDNSGSLVGSGVYFVRVQQGEYMAVRKLMRIRKL